MDEVPVCDYFAASRFSGQIACLKKGGILSQAAGSTQDRRQPGSCVRKNQYHNDAQRQRDDERHGRAEHNGQRHLGKTFHDKKIDAER